MSLKQHSVERSLEKKERWQSKGALWWLIDLHKCPVTFKVDGVAVESLQKQEVLQQSKETQTCTLSTPREGFLFHIFFKRLETN